MTDRQSPAIPRDYFVAVKCMIRTKPISLLKLFDAIPVFYNSPAIPGDLRDAGDKLAPSCPGTAGDLQDDMCLIWAMCYDMDMATGEESGREGKGRGEEGMMRP